MPHDPRSASEEDLLRRMKDSLLRFHFTATGEITVFVVRAEFAGTIGGKVPVTR